MPNNQPNEAAHGVGIKVGAVVLTFLAAVACMGFSYWMYRPGPDLTPAVEPRRTSLTLPPKANLFKGWGKPEFVIVLSAEEHGYLLPCGCSSPQKGGLERRYNFVQILRDKGWPVMLLDLGDVAQEKAPVELLANLQQIPKYKTAMYARKAMDYTAVGLGPIEANNLFNLYGNYTLNVDKPSLLAANLQNRKDYPGIEEYAEVTPQGSDVKVFVTSIMGSVNAEHRPKGDTVQFDFGGDSLTALRKIANKSDFRVLLYNGYTNIGKNDKPEAVMCAEAFPEYQLMVALSGEFDEPPEKIADKLIVKHKGTGGETPIITLGHKAKYIGVVGIFKTGKKSAPYEWKYQLVEMTEDFVTPKAEEKDHPIAKLMEEYTLELKRDGYLAKYPQHKHPLQVQHPGNKKPEFDGTDSCKGCHNAAYNVWAGSQHSKAYATLVDAKHERRPGNRQFDPECIVCHTVGFSYESGFFDENKTKHLQNVGCENCHGPSSEHIMAEAGANLQLKQEWRKAINPWKYQTLPKEGQVKQIEQMCMKCHDTENDVNWTGPKAFDKHWELVKHYKPQPQQPAAPMPERH